MRVVNSRDFRANTAKYVSEAYQGEDVVVRSRIGKWRVVPVEDEPIASDEITPALRRKIEKARKDFREGKCIECRTPEELEAYFNSL
ncbi:MAG: hypothetical protein IJT97_11665 [Bacteroidaceae bacterium]|nr:hypothetical protein [Bacteroidaceae bacterium]